jgi:hypothetical protein
MSKFGGELVLRMPPISKNRIIQIAEQVLSEIAPEMLEAPRPLPVLRLIDYSLPKLKVFITPVAAGELPYEEALTLPDDAGGGAVDVLIRTDGWHSILRGGRAGNRARATVMHELGHVVLHVPHVRKMTALMTPEMALARHQVPREQLEPFRDPEWQAWTFAMCIGMPPSMVRTMRNPSPASVARTFEVSEQFAANYLKRFADHVKPRGGAM